MKIKELKKIVDNLPDDAILYDIERCGGIVIIMPDNSLKYFKPDDNKHMEADPGCKKVFGSGFGFPPP